MLLGHYIIISIFLGRRPNVQDFKQTAVIYVMATNASCAIVIEDQADQVGSANDFTCNGVPKKRKASDFLCRNAKLLGLRPRPRWGSLQPSPIPPSWCPPPAPSPGRCRPLLCPTYSHPSKKIVWANRC